MVSKEAADLRAPRRQGRAKAGGDSAVRLATLPPSTTPPRSGFVQRGSFDRVGQRALVAATCRCTWQRQALPCDVQPREPYLVGGAQARSFRPVSFVRNHSRRRHCIEKYHALQVVAFDSVVSDTSSTKLDTSPKASSKVVISALHPIELERLLFSLDVLSSQRFPASMDARKRCRLLVLRRRLQLAPVVREAHRLTAVVEGDRNLRPGTDHGNAIDRAGEHDPVGHD